MPPSRSSPGRTNHRKSNDTFDLPRLLATLSAASLERQEYILRHLATHLASGNVASAERLDALLTLRCDLGNVWYFLKASGGPASLFLDDVNLAWRRIEGRNLSHDGATLDDSFLETQFTTRRTRKPLPTEEFNRRDSWRKDEWERMHLQIVRLAGRPPRFIRTRNAMLAVRERDAQRAVALEVRYALMASSVRRQFSRIPPTSYGALIQSGFWTSIQALDNCLLQDNVDYQAKALVSLLPQCDNTVKTLAIAQLLQLWHLLRPREQSQPSVLHSNNLGQSPPIDMVGQLEDQSMRRALASMLRSRTNDSIKSSEILVAAGSHLTEGQVREVLDSLLLRTTSIAFADLRAIVTVLTPSSLCLALGHTQSITDAHQRIRVLGILCRQAAFPSESAAAVREEILSQFSLAPNTFRMTHSLDANWTLLSVIEDVLPVIIGEVTNWPAAVEQLLTPSWQASAVAILATHLTEPQAKLLWPLANGLRWPEARIKAVAALLPRMSEDTRNRALSELLTWIAGIETDYDRAEALRDIASAVTVETENAAFRIVQSIGTEDHRWLAVNALALTVSETIIAKFYEMALEVPNEWLRFFALCTIMGRISNDKKMEVGRKAVALALKQNEDQLGHLFTQLAPVAAPETLSKAVDLLAPMGHRAAAALKSILPYLGSLPAASRKAAYSLLAWNDSDECNYALAAYYTYVSPKKEVAAFLSREIENPRIAAKRIIAIVPYLARAALPTVVDLAVKIHDDVSMSRAVGAVIYYMYRHEKEHVTIFSWFRNAMIHVRERITAERQPKQMLDRAVSLCMNRVANDTNGWSKKRVYRNLLNYGKLTDDELQVAISGEYEENVLSHLWADAALYRAFDATESERKRLCEEIINEVDLITKDSDRAHILTGVAELCGKSCSLAVLSRVAGEVSRLGDHELRQELLEILAPCIATAPIPAARKIFTLMLQRLATNPRDHLMMDLAALRPLIFAIGGKTACIESMQAILDTKLSWP